jgi:hypothetical protein
VRIDAHHHVWDLAVRDQPWTADIPALRRTFTFEELRPQLADAGISATVLVQTITVAEETPEFLALAEESPEIRGVVGWVDLTAADIADRLAELNDGTRSGCCARTSCMVCGPWPTPDSPSTCLSPSPNCRPPSARRARFPSCAASSITAANR